MTSTKRSLAVLVASLSVLALISVSQAQSAPLIFAGAGSNLPITRILADAFIKDHPGVVIEIPASGSTGAIKAAADGAVTLGLMRIPVIPAAWSGGKRPPNPVEGGHPSERSDAGC